MTRGARRRQHIRLDDFGASAEALGLTREDLVRVGIVILFGLPPNRVDLLTAITGIEDFDTAWEARNEHIVRTRQVPFLGRSTLVANKRATGRTKDLADLEALGE